MTVIDGRKPTSIRVATENCAQWKVTATAWSEASGQLRQYQGYGTGSTPMGRQEAKHFLKVPDKSKVISLTYEYYGEMS